VSAYQICESGANVPDVGAAFREARRIQAEDAARDWLDLERDYALGRGGLGTWRDLPGSAALFDLENCALRWPLGGVQ
jgi:hypothetical protein